MIRAVKVNLGYPKVEDLIKQLEWVFNSQELERLHLLSDYDLFVRENDQSTIWHKLFYEYVTNKAFQVWYKYLIRNSILPVLGDSAGIVYQTIPTFRVHLPNNVAVGEMHSDADYGHSPEEINCWLPLTKTNETNSLWLENNAGEGDETPIFMVPGQLLIFDGVNFLHGNHINRSGKTRVSIDFRVIPGMRYKGHKNASINSGMKFTVGDYFSEMKI